jgi:predicted nucleic acid-binding protein
MGKIALATFTGQKLYLDTNTFIYALEHHADYAAILDLLLASIDAGNIRSFTSEITLAECLVKPFADGNTDLQGRYQAALANRPGFTMAPVSRHILIQAAQVRAVHKLRLPDAIHLATALDLACDTFITNDRLIKPLPGITLVQLADVIP